MSKSAVLERIQALDAYAPGLSIAEIRRRHGLERVIKLASNENPLGASPLAQEAIRRNAALAFRYPQSGNPRLAQALAKLHGVAQECIVAGNGSDEIIDLLIRILAASGEHSLVCCEPCFSIYPIQARVAGIELRRCPLRDDFSQNLDGLCALADASTRLVFLTTPDNPSGYCPPQEGVARLAARLAETAPKALLAIDEAYMDFAEDETASSLLAAGTLPENVAVLRTFSKSWGLAGLRLGYGILPPAIADGFWRSRLPFSVNVLAEEAALAALEDEAFRKATLETVRTGRKTLASGLVRLGCRVWPSEANFLMFSLPQGHDAKACFEALLARGIIIRPLSSYGLPDHLRVSVGNQEENAAFLLALEEELACEARP